MSEFAEFVEHLTSDNTHFRKAEPMLVHASMGVSEEAGEILGIVKKALWYGKEME